MRKFLFLIALLLSLIDQSYAQADYCNELIPLAIEHLKGNEYKEPNYEHAFGLLSVCANREDPEALNLLGLMHLRGQYTTVNEDKAFELIEKSANMGYHPAEYNLGRFYKLGTGCNIDFAKALHWFEQAAHHGNERAAYSLGYMYLKGFGVEQSYEKAIEWLQISPWPMAQHWLAYCYYLGYGVEQDKEKALELLYSNKVINSHNLYQRLESDPQIEVRKKIEKEILKFKNDNIENLASFINAKNTNKNLKKIDPEDLSGSWKGSFIEFDWSGKKIEGIIPVSLELNSTNEVIDYVLDIDSQIMEDFAIKYDNSLYFEDLHVEIDMPYSDNDRHKRKLRVLSSFLEIKKRGNNSYLIGKLETYSDELKEPGPPVSIILANTKNVSNENPSELEENEEELQISEEALVSLTKQENQFIQLYPNPFVHDILIQYEIPKPSHVSIEIFSYMGTERKMIVSGMNQQAGKHNYNIDGTNLPQGLYIISVNVNNEKFSRIVVKE